MSRGADEVCSSCPVTPKPVLGRPKGLLDLLSACRGSTPL
eukprot:CAMPEP_0114119804 /NCGR_PEP_ID=MMETSP0043_2-20121206/6306_1 /TAXON_ID=464988 /ORGANISM="Hemiselmis andersenii, Strain CCMP644" /LENGTH=39 /DNA_ID= /DNA_START= /DNA_END= /DNA_ORIENTATION=